MLVVFVGEAAEAVALIVANVDGQVVHVLEAARPFQRLQFAMPQPFSIE